MEDNSIDHFIENVYQHLHITMFISAKQLMVNTGKYYEVNTLNWIKQNHEQIHMKKYEILIDPVCEFSRNRFLGLFVKI